MASAADDLFRINVTVVATSHRKDSGSLLFLSNNMEISLFFLLRANPLSSATGLRRKGGTSRD